MSVADFRNIIIPAIKSFVNAPIIEADQLEDRPDEPHATYKVTLPYSKGIGQPDMITSDTDIGLDAVYIENFKATVSINTYAFDDPENGVFDLSENLAQKMHDWFRFQGVSILSDNGIVIIDITDVSNRDAIIVENYERRHGFDCIMRMSREITNENIDYFDNVVWINE